MLKHAAASLLRALKLARTDPDRWLAWSLASAFLGLLVSLFSVSLFGPPVTLFYILLSFCPVLEKIMIQENQKIIMSQDFLDQFVNAEKGALV